jgi:hypothetical protein
VKVEGFFEYKVENCLRALGTLKPDSQRAFAKDGSKPITS